MNSKIIIRGMERIISLSLSLSLFLSLSTLSTTPREPSMTCVLPAREERERGREREGGKERRGEKEGEGEGEGEKDRSRE